MAPTADAAGARRWPAGDHHRGRCAHLVRPSPPQPCVHCVRLNVKFSARGVNPISSCASSSCPWQPGDIFPEPCVEEIERGRSRRLLLQRHGPTADIYRAEAVQLDARGGPEPGGVHVHLAASAGTQARAEHAAAGLGASRACPPPSSIVSPVCCHRGTLRRAAESKAARTGDALQNWREKNRFRHTRSRFFSSLVFGTVAHRSTSLVMTKAAGARGCDVCG